VSNGERGRNGEAGTVSTIGKDLDLYDSTEQPPYGRVARRSNKRLIEGFRPFFIDVVA
jgi:hypothetical protein